MFATTFCVSHYLLRKIREECACEFQGNFTARLFGFTISITNEDAPVCMSFVHTRTRILIEAWEDARAGRASNNERFATTLSPVTACVRMRRISSGDASIQSCFVH